MTGNLLHFIPLDSSLAFQAAQTYIHSLMTQAQTQERVKNIILLVSHNSQTYFLLLQILRQEVWFLNEELDLLPEIEIETVFQLFLSPKGGGWCSICSLGKSVMRVKRFPESTLNSYLVNQFCSWRICYDACCLGNEQPG